MKEVCGGFELFGEPYDGPLARVDKAQRAKVLVSVLGDLVEEFDQLCVQLCMFGAELERHGFDPFELIAAGFEDAEFEGAGAIAERVMKKGKDNILVH